MSENSVEQKIKNLSAEERARLDKVWEHFKRAKADNSEWQASQNVLQTILKKGNLTPYEYLSYKAQQENPSPGAQNGASSQQGTTLKVPVWLVEKLRQEGFTAGFRQGVAKGVLVSVEKEMAADRRKRDAAREKEEEKARRAREKKAMAVPFLIDACVLGFAFSTIAGNASDPRTSAITYVVGTGVVGMRYISKMIRSFHDGSNNARDLCGVGHVTTWTLAASAAIGVVIVGNILTEAKGNVSVPQKATSSHSEKERQQGPEAKGFRVERGDAGRPVVTILAQKPNTKNL